MEACKEENKLASKSRSPEKDQRRVWRRQDGDGRHFFWVSVWVVVVWGRRKKDLGQDLDDTVLQRATRKRNTGSQANSKGLVTWVSLPMCC